MGLTKITSTIFIEILKGEHNNSRSQYKNCYRNTININREKITIIELSNFHFVNEINVNYLDCNYGVTIKESLIEKKISFLSSTFIEFNFFKVQCLSSINFYGNTSISRITTGNLSVKDGVKFQEGYYGVFLSTWLTTSEITISGGHFDSFNLTGNVSNISIFNETTYFDKLSLNIGIKGSNIDITNIKVNNLRLSGVFKDSNRIEVKDVDVFSLFLTLINKGVILFNNIGVRDFKLIESDITISDFYKNNNVEYATKKELQSYSPEEIIDEDNRLRFLHIAYNSKVLFKKRRQELFEEKKDDSRPILQINKSEIGDLTFKNFKLKDFQEVEIIDSDLSSLKTFNSSFPIEKVKGNPTTLYEIFNDLYSVAKSKHNTFEQINYFKASQSFLLESIKTTDSSDWSSIISLTLSKWYSDFGSSWTKAFKVTFMISVITFSSMVLLTTHEIEISEVGFYKFLDLIPYYLQFLNPTHKYTFMDNKLITYTYSENLFFSIFDTISRVFISIGVFELIVSYRKFLRK